MLSLVTGPLCVVSSQINSLLLGRMRGPFSRFKDKPGNCEFEKVQVGWMVSRGGGGHAGTWQPVPAV